MALDLSGPSGKRTRISVFDRGSLLRLIDARHLYAIGYGDVGSSIFYALGVTTAVALGATPIAIAIAGFFFLCTCMTYAELGAAIPEAGGSSSFARYAFNDFWSFIAGWALLLDYVVTIAISAYAVVSYASEIHPAVQFLDSHPGIHIGITIALILLLFLVNLLGIKESSRVSMVLCSLGLLIKGLVIALGLLTVVNLPSIAEIFWNFLKIGPERAGFIPSWAMFFKGIAMAMVAYIGIESIAQLAGEAKNPGKAVPRAILSVMVTLLIVYAGITIIAFCGALTPEQLQSADFRNKPLNVIALALPYGGEAIAVLVAVLGGLILAVAANAGLVGCSRLTFTMGEHFQLPNTLYRLHPEYKTPWVALLAFSLIASLIVFLGEDLESLAELYNFGAMLSFMMAHLALIGLRVIKPEMERPFLVRPNVSLGRGVKVPLFAILGFLGCFAVWVDVIWSKPAGRYLGVLWVLLGIMAFLAYRTRQHITLNQTVELEKVQLEGYSRLRCRKILAATRGSAAMETLQQACKLAQTDGASLLVVYVVEVPEHLPADTFLPQQFIEGEKALQRAEAIAGDYGIPIEKRSVQARTAGEAICEVATQEGCDLIVIGSPTKRPIGERLASRTMDHVLRNAPCRVVVYTTGAAEAGGGGLKRLLPLTPSE